MNPLSPFFKFLYQPYKWIVVIPAVFILTMILGLVCILTGFIFNPDAANIIAVIWSRLCCAVVPIKVRIHNRENYRQNQSYVIVANHQSMADIPVVHGYLGLNIKWIMKKELEKIPVFGAACHHLGCIYVDRKKPDKAILSLQTAQKNLSQKASVLFFAEGTRSRNGKVMPFKKGAFRFACESHMPILPITIKNAVSVLPSDSLDITPGQIDIIIHPPVHMRDTKREAIDRARIATRKIISDAL